MIKLKNNDTILMDAEVSKGITAKIEMPGSLYRKMLSLINISGRNINIGQFVLQAVRVSIAKQVRFDVEFLADYTNSTAKELGIDLKP